MSYNFKTVMGQSSYRPFKQWNEGDYLVGKYISEGQDNFNNPSYKVEVIEADFGKDKTPAVGSIFTLNSSGSLNKAMETIEVDDIVKVTYEGEGIVEKGKFKGKAFHKMKVEVATANGEAKTNAADDEYLP